MTSPFQNIYRPATLHDIASVASLNIELCEYLGEPFKAADLIKAHENYFLNPDHHCYVVEVKGEIVGTLGFFATPELRNNSVITAHEQYWYIKPSYRGLGVGLIKYVEKHLKCDRIEFGIADPRLQQLLELLGYKPIKTIMRKELLCAEAVE